MLLAAGAVALAQAASLLLALAAAYWRGRWPDTAVCSYCSLAVAVPDFVIGLVLLTAVVYRLHVGAVISAGSVANVWLR